MWMLFFLSVSTIHKAQEEQHWVQNPFSHSVETTCKLEVSDREHLIDLSSDSSLQDQYRVTPLDKFWVGLKGEYPCLYKKALPILLSFASDYLCESGFSSLAYVKNKYRNKLDVEASLRLKLSSTTQRIAKLCSAMQSHPSH